ncbi:MAG TPA: hypothetical protein VLZ50_08505 [Terracidiphilus sp.]|nr:hypothetical protein [Terracidiphilus sp.]
MATPSLVYQPRTVDIPFYGKLAMAPIENAPLLVVFGGIPVRESILDPTDKAHANDMVQSGDYMWKYFTNLRNRFHIFVAYSPKVDGALAYRYLLYTLQWKGDPPAVCPVDVKTDFSGPYQILYLFSGGYKPGIELMNRYSSKLFSSVFLVDIWMKAGSVSSYYQNFAAANADKTYYIHTEFGADNPTARDFITRRLGTAKAPLVSGRVGEKGMQTHMRTNEVAVGNIW